MRLYILLVAFHKKHSNIVCAFFSFLRQLTCIISQLTCTTIGWMKVAKGIELCYNLRSDKGQNSRLKCHGEEVNYRRGPE